MPEGTNVTDSIDKIETKIAEHEQKFARQHEATQDLINRVCALERKLAKMEKQQAA